MSKHLSYNDNPGEELPGYPEYPAEDDIFNQGQVEPEIDPEMPFKIKSDETINRRDPLNEKDFESDMSGSDLDIPGSELDDSQEIIGSEDEENNYYSLGGDDHENLDEDNER